MEVCPLFFSRILRKLGAYEMCCGHVFINFINPKVPIPSHTIILHMQLLCYPLFDMNSILMGRIWQSTFFVPPVTDVTFHCTRCLTAFCTHICVEIVESNGPHHFFLQCSSCCNNCFFCFSYLHYLMGLFWKYVFFYLSCNARHISEYWAISECIAWSQYFVSRISPNFHDRMPFVKERSYFKTKCQRRRSRSNRKWMHICSCVENR